MKKIQSLTLEKYFQLVKPKYTFLKITPHKSIRNYNSTNIAKAITHTWKGINRRVRREQKKLFFETNFKISYIIDIEENNANFYFMVPIVFKAIILKKITEIWSKATIVEVEGIKPFSTDSIAYQLNYKKEDALSLQVDKKSNEPLNSILNVIEIMEETDRVTIIYNFLPRSQFGWLKQYTDTMDKLKEHKPVEKEKMNLSYAGKSALTFFLSLLDDLFEILNDFAGGKKKKTNNQSLAEALATALESVKELSPATKKKKETRVLDTQIAVVSSSNDPTRRDNNALSICHSYRVLDEDNELQSKKAKEIPNIHDYKFKDIDINTFSTDECQNFIQIPGRQLLRQFNINYIKTEETILPEELRSGYMCLGENVCKGMKTPAYLENTYDVGNYPLCLIGAQGSGKTTLINNLSVNCSKNNDGIVLLDFIKGCELSENIRKLVPESKLVVINLANEKDIQGLGYNEIKVSENMSTYEKLDLASKQAQQIMSLVDSISVGDPLSSRMRRFLNAAANVSLCLGYTSVKSIVDCLEDYKIREEYIKSLDLDTREYLSSEISTLEELDEWSKATKDNPSEKIGTKDSKIEHILDRIAMLREDFKLKFMYNKSCENNIDLVECMEQGKVVLIQMKESDFPTKMIKNILITYWISKIWLASQIRGSMHGKPRRVNIIVDEVFQAPTCMNTLEYIIPQSRKFGCKFIFSTQYINQLEDIFETLEASGSSYMLLKGATENDFNHFKSKLDDFEFEDLRDMEKYSSLNLIYYSKGYSSFITKLPKPI